MLAKIAHTVDTKSTFVEPNRCSKATAVLCAPAARTARVPTCSRATLARKQQPLDCKSAEARGFRRIISTQLAAPSATKNGMLGTGSDISRASMRSSSALSKSSACRRSAVKTAFAAPSRTTSITLRGERGPQAACSQNPAFVTADAESAADMARMADVICASVTSTS